MQQLSPINAHPNFFLYLVAVSPSPVTFIYQMPASFLSPTVFDDAPLPLALQIRTAICRDSPSRTLYEMHPLDAHLFFPCPDDETPLQLSIVHPESPLIFSHASHLSAPPFYEKFTTDALVTSDTFSLPERDRRPSAIVIDAIGFPHDEDISPASSTSGDSAADTTVSEFGNCTLEMFFASGSRVVRFFNLPHHVSTFLGAMFAQQRVLQLPIPMTLWELRPNYGGPMPSQRSVWAVYKSHDEARTALSLSGSLMSVIPALENELQPFHKLRRVDPMTPSVSPLPPSPTFFPSQVPRMMPSVADRGATRSVYGTKAPHRADFTISTNPPNPRTSFRLGDWICGAPTCAAHNFGRNVMCIGCGCPRPCEGPPSPHSRNPQSMTRPLPSPRFATLSSGFPSDTSFSKPPTLQPTIPPLQKPSKLPSLSHPPLTPSGRAFSSSGRVRNVSSDLLNPCIMYWPDNEPLPEQGQIRPSGLVGISQPPILNTGNRGPIEHQPGDWICLKCNYLNWRRRKVCQTCYPYAEGNGDSISTAVQAERIALLTSVLAQNGLSSKLSPSPTSSDSCDARPPSLSSTDVKRSVIDISNTPRRPLHCSSSNIDLTAQYIDSQPIYQTSGHRQPSPSVPYPGGHILHAPVPLLPSFLQDIIQSPTLSPVSSSSPLSFDGYEASVSSPARSYVAQLPSAKSSLSHLPSSNIWRLDGEESKNLSAIASNRRESLGGNPTANLDIMDLRRIHIA